MRFLPQGKGKEEEQWEGVVNVIRAYARIVGLVLVLVGLAHLSGLLGAAEEASSWGPGLYQLGLGSLFVCSGFLRGSARAVRQMVGGLGVLTLLGTAVDILAPFLVWGGALLWGPIAVTGLVVGILSLLAASYLPDGTQQTRRSK